jgi:hypothetical protein
MLIGRMQDQQISVIGFGNLPVQVGIPAGRAGRVEKPKSSARRKWSLFKKQLWLMA